MASTLILVAGYAGSGKTRVGQDVARRLPACYLDKDTLAGPFVERLLAALNLPAGDRDSPAYQREIRPLEYEALLAAGLEAAALGADVVLSAPFLAQLTDNAWASWLSEQALERNVQLRTVWVACDPDTLRQRMVERGSPRDCAKLADWTAYAAALDQRLDRRFQVEAWHFDNSARSDYQTQLNQLIDALKAA